MTKQTPEILPTLTVCIPTFGAIGIQDVAKQQLPEIDGVDYVVSWQQSLGDIPSELQRRRDIRVFRIDGRGVSANRNNALDHAAGDVLLIADDDIDYKPEWLNTVRQSFAQHPESMFFLFQMKSLMQKQYPCKESTRIVNNLPKNHYATSCELAIRRTVIEHGIRFDERFGINAPLFTMGEDSLIVLQMMRMGFEGRYEPTVICFNHDTTSGQRHFKDPRQVASTGVLFAWQTPATAIPRALLKSVRMARSGQGPFIFSLVNLIKGVYWGYTHTPPWHKSKKIKQISKS